MNCVTKMGRIINIQHFSLDDGPGIRTVVFLKGCPLRCAWCHNPESQDYRFELMYRKERCRNCGGCADKCLLGLHRMTEKHEFYRGDCRGCGRCSEGCAFGALEMVGQDISVQEIMAELLTERPFYEHSGGGVTVSGGEPLMQPEFTKALLQACKAEGLHTCVETCGYGDKGVLLELQKYTDLFLFDYKLTDSEAHRKFTGVSNGPILANLEAICNSGADVILRCPMIPGVNITQDHVQGIVETAGRFSNIREIHLEPYHPLGVSKAEALGREASYDRATFLEKSELAWVLQHIRDNVSVPVKVL